MRSAGSKFSDTKPNTSIRLIFVSFMLGAADVAGEVVFVVVFAAAAAAAAAFGFVAAVAARAVVEGTAKATLITSNAISGKRTSIAEADGFSQWSIDRDQAHVGPL